MPTYVQHCSVLILSPIYDSLQKNVNSVNMLMLLQNFISCFILSNTEEALVPLCGIAENALRWDTI